MASLRHRRHRSRHWMDGRTNCMDGTGLDGGSPENPTVARAAACRRDSSTPSFTILSADALRPFSMAATRAPTPTDEDAPAPPSSVPGRQETTPQVGGVGMHMCPHRSVVCRCHLRYSQTSNRPTSSPLAFRGVCDRHRCACAKATGGCVPGHSLRLIVFEHCV